MDFREILSGVKASIIASSCCSLPLALALLFTATGVGSITLALRIARYKNYFLALGSLFLIISIYLTIKRKSGGTCKVCDLRKNYRLIAINILTYIILTLTIIYGILPLISEWVFK
jgi:hypothetical protein